MPTRPWNDPLIPGRGTAAIFDPTRLTDDDLKLSEAWKKAAGDLGVSVVAPFTIVAPDGRPFLFAAMVSGFNGKGIVCRAMPEDFQPEQCGEIWEVADDAGYAAHNLAPCFFYYDRKWFKLLLDGCEWVGPEDLRPPWYTGHAMEDGPLPEEFWSGDA